MAATDLDNNAPLKMYLHELATIPPLTNDEEASLLHHVRTQDDQAKSAGARLVEATSPWSCPLQNGILLLAFPYWI